VIRSLKRAGLLTLTEDEELIPARDLGIQLCDVAARGSRRATIRDLAPVAGAHGADGDEGREFRGSRDAGADRGITLRELASQQPAP
jgi:hypothetical protein